MTFTWFIYSPSTEVYFNISHKLALKPFNAHILQTDTFCIIDEKSVTDDKGKDVPWPILTITIAECYGGVCVYAATIVPCTIAIWWLLGVSQLVVLWRLWPGRHSPGYRHALCARHHRHYSQAATPTDGALLMLMSGLWLHTEEAHWAPATGWEACVSSAALKHFTFHAIICWVQGPPVLLATQDTTRRW